YDRKSNSAEILSMYSDTLRMLKRYQEGYYEALEASRLLPESRVLSVKKKLAAIQVGKFDPISEGLEQELAREIVSPFSMIIAAGWALQNKDTRKSNLYLNQALTHTTKIPSLSALADDPIFKMPASL
ncbi:MAG: hypothetical protein AAF558_09465, partial [Verrucomicrobiota bacterium]